MPEVVSFSIIVPTYNRGHLLKQTLLSALLLDYDHYEIIVVDDGSTDNTEEIMRGFSNDKVRYYKKQNEERAAARNFGVAQANGDYVCFLDSDDFLYPHHLNTAHDYILQHQQPEVFHLNYDFVDEHKNILRRGEEFVGEDAINQRIIKGNCLSCNGVFIRKDIALSYPFNTDRALSASEDYELWLRLASRFIIGYSNVITSSILSHDERSVVTLSKEKMIARINKLIQYAFADKLNKKVYADKLTLFQSQCMLYLSLHLAIAKERTASLQYLFAAIKLRPLAVFDRRFLGIMKTLIVNI